MIWAGREEPQSSMGPSPVVVVGCWARCSRCRSRHADDQQKRQPAQLDLGADAGLAVVEPGTARVHSSRGASRVRRRSARAARRTSPRSAWWWTATHAANIGPAQLRDGPVPLCANRPRLRAERIDVVSASRWTGLMCSAPTPVSVSTDDIRCESKDGVLTVHIPKVKVEASKAKQIKVE